ncbi:MAG: cyanase [Verrucomicrobia bacterium]|nr:cyanase [Verrucomicrobiota bacterium]
MNKITMTEVILAAKSARKASWQQLAATTGLTDVYLISACLGQNSLDADEADKLCAALGLDPEVSSALQAFPTKGMDPHLLQDPVIYRFQEIIYVYGPTLKEIIHEKLGNGIMSAIDFTMQVDKVEDPKGDRVKVTMCGKFLPYKKW